MQSMYDPAAVQPMRDELNQVGIQDLTTVEEVDEALTREGSCLVVVNSVCGCAAGNARPGVMLALQHHVIPDRLFAVFAGMEREAVERARSHFEGYAPSSPSIAVLQDGKVVRLLERSDIEGRAPAEIAAELTKVFDRHCSRKGPSIPREEFEKIRPVQICGSGIPRLDA